MHVFKLHTLCQYYGLGTPETPLINITGGFQHEIAKLNTEQGSYVIKCLHPGLVKQYGLAHFSQNEGYAAALKNAGIPACTALRPDAPVLTLASRHYLVYPWLNGKTLTKAELNTQHAETIGTLLAAIHAQRYQAPQISWPKLVQLPDAHLWARYKDWLKPSFLQTALNDSLPIINDLLAAYRMMQTALAQQSWVYSHTDLTPANVLWEAAQPTLIDWELAGPIMPGQDVLATALNWSLDDQGNIRRPLFKAFLQGYRNVAPLPTINKFDLIATFIDWLAWASWNLEQVFDINLSESIRERSAKQANYSLMALQKTYLLRHELLPQNN